MWHKIITLTHSSAIHLNAGLDSMFIVSSALYVNWNGSPLYLQPMTSVYSRGECEVTLRTRINPYLLISSYFFWSGGLWLFICNDFALSLPPVLLISLFTSQVSSPSSQTSPKVVATAEKYTAAFPNLEEILGIERGNL